MAKAKGKQWYKIKAPKLFNEKVIGETLSLDPENMIGRVISSTLMEFDTKVNKYYIKLFFKINSLEGEILKTSYCGHECTKDFIARVVRKGTERLDINDIFQLKDGKMRIKVVAVYNGRVSLSTATSLRKKLNELLIEKTKEASVDNFIKGFISDSIQRSMKEKLNKIYPIRVLEIRKTKII